VKSRSWILYAFAAAVTFAVYLPSLDNGFVDWDDNANFIDNEHYRGLGVANLRWMATAFVLGHYQPLSWVTLGFDYLVWGMNPFGYHLTNVILHALAAWAFAALAAAIFAMRGSTTVPDRRSWSDAAFGTAVALAWSVHPLRVEAVSWITERREVLCGLLTLLAVSSHLRRRPAWQTWVLAGLAMLAKVTAATIPAFFVLIDVHRAGWTDFRGLARTLGRSLVRQLPLVGLAAILVGTAFLAQHESAALVSYEVLPLWRRLVLTLHGAAFAVIKSFWPSGLAVLHQGTVGLDWQFKPFLWWQAMTALAVTIAAFVIGWRRRALGSLVLLGAFYVCVLPTGGLGQSGPQTAAERYTYQPAWVITLAVGLVLARASGWPRRQPPLVRVVLPLLLLCGPLAWLTIDQQAVWRESETLWLRELEVHPDSPTGNHQLGRHYVGRVPPRFDLAEPRFRAAFAAAPTYTDPQHALGLLLRNTGRTKEAIAVFTNLARGWPLHRDTWFQLGMLLWETGDRDNAINGFDNYLRLDRGDASAWRVLAKAQAAAGRPRDAIATLESGIAAAPCPALWSDLAWLLATHPDQAMRDGTRALSLAEKVIAEGAADFKTVVMFAAACAEAGEFDRGAREVAAALSKLPPEAAPALQQLLDDLAAHRVVRVEPRFP
jgi:protein O-mannosyl-transferase